MDSWDWAGDLITTWRVLNAVIALSSIYWLWVCFNRGNYMSTTRMLPQAHSLALFAIAWASVEALIQGNPLGGRTLLHSAAIIWTLLALWRNDYCAADRPK